ncbi:Thiamin pyrophosphokinase 1 [Auxenochlorella protothecoides]|uniref:thiamine diphosphokinase n=2 Tax=Auxenochlorella protothecoides TaxID=3075 RepID=A0A087SPH7_AUXPR|nr:Thiamin pyrophosphokinase 1 [Auxenochlorella protothecoides]KFM27631.1 Thiamin pyrophosphokinase 1 [Auxenochlorella protothecoides]
MGAGQTRVLTSTFLEEDAASSGRPLAAVLLNWTLPSLAARVWQRATLRICADGGANRLYDELRGPSHASDSVPMPHPHAIIGDLDSIRPEVAAYYRDAGVAITDLSHDQDSTDLQKCVEYAAAHGSRPQHIVAFGAHGGRLDHILSNLGCLYRYRHLNLVLVGEGNITRLVPHDTEMRMGGLLSTSNILEAEEVVVESDSDLIWTVQCKG